MSTTITAFKEDPDRAVKLAKYLREHEVPAEAIEDLEDPGVHRVRVNTPNLSRARLVTRMWRRGGSLYDYDDLTDWRADDHYSYAFTLQANLASDFQVLGIMPPNKPNYEAADLLKESGRFDDLAFDEDHESGCCYYYFSDVDNALAFIDTLNNFVRDKGGTV